jgi:hypothetical protein
VGRSSLDLELLDHPRQARRLTSGQLEHQPGERRGVDHRVLERRGQAAAHEIRVERVVAVLDEHRSPREAQEGGTGLAESRRADQHRAVDLVPLLRVPVDRGPRLDQRVEKRQRPVEAEALGADLDHEEGPVAGGLDVEGHVLGVLEQRFRCDRGRRPGQLLEDDLAALPRLETNA